MLTKKKPLFLVLSLVLSTQFVFADREESIPVGSRELDQHEQELIRNRRIKEYENEQAQSQPAHAEGLFKKTYLKLTPGQTPFTLAPSFLETPLFVTTGYTSLPISSHTLYSVADNDRSLELEDGSHWEISDPSTARTWRPGDLLTLTPDYSWFSSYNYYITNKSANSYVKANLKVGPFAFGNYSNWIVDIDHFAGHIYLQNGMVWCASAKDQYLIKRWTINDHIIIGLENSIWPYYDHILINVNMDEYIRVKQY